MVISEQDSTHALGASPVDRGADDSVSPRSSPAGFPRAARGILRAGAAILLLAGASGCLFGGSSDEEKIDPNEATAREDVYRSKAELERDERFRDRLQRRPRLDAPAGPASGQSGDDPK